MIEQPALTIEKLHREHGERIRRYLARLVGTTETEDLEQDVFEKAQRALGTLRGDSRVLTWLYRVATNVAIDRLRTAGRRADLEPVGGPVDVESTSATNERSVDGELDRTRTGARRQLRARRAERVRLRTQGGPRRFAPPAQVNATRIVSGPRFVYGGGESTSRWTCKG
jgi:RNA polymerase sigma factor (sigma-70 family)